MILVQYRRGPFEIMLYLAALRPWYADHPVDVAAHNRGLGGHRRHHFQLAKFCLRFRASLFGHLCRRDTRLQFVQFAGRFIHVAQFFLDSLHLFVQIVLTLALFHLLLDAPANALLNLEQINFCLHEPHEVLEPIADFRNLKNMLLFIEIDHHVSGDCVSQPARLVDARQRGQNLGRYFFAQIHVLLELVYGGTQQSFDLFFRDVLTKDLPDTRDRKAAGIVNVRHRRSVATFHQNLDRAVRQLQQLENIRDSPHLVQLVSGWVVVCCVALGNQQDLLVVGHGIFQGLNRFLPADEQGQHHMRIDNNIAQGQKRQFSY